MQVSVKSLYLSKINCELADAGHVEEVDVNEVEPGDEEGHQKAGVRDGEGREVVGGAELAEFRGEEHEDGQRVADRAEQHEQRRVVQLEPVQNALRAIVVVQSVVVRAVVHLTPPVTKTYK